MSQTKVKSGLLNFPDQTDFVKLPSGTTAQRPSSSEKGYSRYNTTDNKLEYWNGTEWQQLPGITPPIITSISYPGDDLAADPAGGQTITITGTDFKTGATVTIGGTTPSVITFISATEITFTAPAKTAGDYDVVVTNVDGGNATAVDGMTYNGLPSWTTPAGNLGSFPAGSTIPTITLVATEPDSGAVSYSVTTGALPTGLALTGADIDGTVPTPAGQTTYNFSVTASDDENQSTERAFNIVVYLQVTKDIVDEVDPFEDGNGVALYKFNGDATDASGNYSFSTASNVSYPSGVFNEGLDLLSGTSYASGTGLTSTFPLTFSFWVKPDGLGSAVGLLINKRTTATNGYSITGTGTTNEMGFLNNGGYAGGGAGIANNLATNTWSHIVVIMNTSGWESYVNGSYYNKYSGTLNNTSNEVRLGKSSGIGNWVGSTWGLDQFRVFNRELTPLEVESLYRERTVVCGGQADTLDILGDNSCIATYQLNGNANDLSGNYSGTPTNVSYGVGEFDLAGNFKALQGNIVTPVGVYSNSFSGHSVSFWMYSGGTNYETPIYTRTSSAAAGWHIRTSTGGNGINWSWQNSSGSVVFASGEESFTFTDGWHHVVAIWDGTTSTNGAKLYIDGSLFDELTANATLASQTFTLGATLGADRQSSGRSILGLDQVRIFNKPLSAGEVTTLYNETACDALACGGTTNTLDILSDGSCIAAYPLDGSPLDLSGNYNGVQSGGLTYPQGEFDLAGSFWLNEITLPQGTMPSGNNPRSVSAWIKTTYYASPYQQIVAYGADGTNNGFYFRTGSSGNPSLGIAFYANDFDVDASSTNLFNGEWHHVVCTIGTTIARLYVDGNQLGGDYNKGTLTTANTEVKISSTNSLISFKGEIDQVRIFNKALSAGEVTTLYNETACN